MAWKKISPALMLVLLYPACVGDNETSPTETSAPCSPERDTGTEALCTALQSTEALCTYPLGAELLDAEPLCDGRTGEAVSAYTTGQVACMIGCGAAASAGCRAVSLVCAAGEVWTVGTVTIPCFIAVLAACAVYGGTGTACGLLCAQK